MKINQLFRVNIPNELFIKLCKSFDFNDLANEFIFCKADLVRINTLSKINDLKDELCQYYIPCKAKLYLSNLNIGKCITIFRQILRLNNMVLISHQKYVQYKKTTFYTIKHNTLISNDDILNENHIMKVTNNHLVVNFS